MLSQFDGRICTLDRELSATVAHDASMQISGPIAVGWAAANASPDTIRAMVGAVVTGIGNIGATLSVLVRANRVLKLSLRPLTLRRHRRHLGLRRHRRADRLPQGKLIQRRHDRFALRMLRRACAVPEGREREAREGWEGLSPEARGSREVSARGGLWRVEVRADETMQVGESSSGFPVYDLIDRTLTRVCYIDMLKVYKGGMFTDLVRERYDSTYTRERTSTMRVQYIAKLRRYEPQI